MRVTMIILMLIIVLAIVGLVFLFIKDKERNTNDFAPWIQAIATVVLVIVTCWYVNEVRVSRISQERSFNQYIEELQEARKQQVKPYVYVFFYWNNNLGKFFTILKNVGSGPAFDIKYSYSTVDDKNKTISHSDNCEVLGAGIETADMTPFASEHMKCRVDVKVSYKDSFGNIIEDTFEHSLHKLANNPPPSNFAEFRRQLETGVHRQDIELRIDSFLRAFDAFQKDVSDIKEQLKNKK